MSEPHEDPKETEPLVTGSYTITSNEPLQTITGPRVEWTTANSVDVSAELAVEDDASTHDETVP